MQTDNAFRIAHSVEAVHVAFRYEHSVEECLMI